MVVTAGQEEARDVLDPDLQQQLHEYRGRWVAITRTKLVAVGDNPNEVARKAAELGVAKPIIYFVPRDGNTSMFF